MSETISDEHITLKYFFLAESYNYAPKKPDRDLSEARSLIQEWTRIGTSPSNLETWLNEHKTPLRSLQKLLKELQPQLSDERQIEVKHSHEVIVFCADHSLIKYLGLVELLTKKYFPTVRKISFSVGYDPETVDKWVSVDIEISGDIDDAIEWEDNFVKEWVTSAAYPERTKFTLSCDII